VHYAATDRQTDTTEYMISRRSTAGGKTSHQRGETTSSLLIPVPMETRFVPEIRLSWYTSLQHVENVSLHGRSSDFSQAVAIQLKLCATLCVGMLL